MDYNELFHSFLDESQKLEDSLLNFNSSKITPNEIIPIYYQVLNVTSMIQILTQNDTLSAADDKKISSVSELINQTFNNKLHLLILDNLNTTIQNLMSELKTNKTKQKTKEVIEQNARDYEKLRELMSTKEFVNQYDKGINHD